MDFEEAAARYAELVATNHEAELKGARMPYTSMNGNMYSYPKTLKPKMTKRTPKS